MLSSISGQNDLWAQLAALRAAQAANQSGQASTSSATTATTSSADEASTSAVTSGTSPMLSNGLLSQLLSLGSVSGGGADGTGGISQDGGTNDIGFPGGPPPFPPQGLADGQAGSASSIANLFSDLQNLISNLTGSLASAGTSDASGSADAASSTDASSAASTTTAGTIDTNGTIDLSASLLKDLQSIAADLGGLGTIAPGSATEGTGWNWVTGGPAGSNGSVSGDSTASGDAGVTATSNSTSTTASSQSAANTLMQQIAQAVTAYMQAVSGQSSTLGTSLPGITA